MLKPFESLLEPDARFAIAAWQDERGGFRPATLADHYATIARLSIGTAAPEAVQRMFSRAQHVFIYSWFDYELSAVAELQAFATVELALRERLQPTSQTMLKALVRRAVDEGLIGRNIGDFPAEIWFSRLRNNLAHGSTSFGGPWTALPIFETCAGLIRRLYPSP